MNVTVVQLIEFEKGLMHGVFELCRQCLILLKFLLALFNRWLPVDYKSSKIRENIDEIQKNESFSGNCLL